MFSAAFAIPATAAHANAPPTLTRRAPASTISRIERPAWASTLTGFEVFSQTDRAADGSYPSSASDGRGRALGVGPVAVLQIDGHRKSGRPIEHSNVVEHLVERRSAVEPPQ